MCTVFWDSKGVILLDFLEPRQTISSDCYIVTLTKLKTQTSGVVPGKSHRIIGPPEIESSSPAKQAPYGRLQSGRIHNLPVWPVPVLCQPYCEVSTFAYWCSTSYARVCGHFPFFCPYKRRQSFSCNTVTSGLRPV